MRKIALSYMNDRNAKIERLKEIIQNEAIAKSSARQNIVSPKGDESNWLIDIRAISFQPATLDLMSDIFWERFGPEYPFQVGGVETSAIALIAAIVLKSHVIGKPVNGFFLRKSRKAHGLQKIVEGQLNEQKIILVDDLINSGMSMVRQIEILERMGKKIGDIFTLVHFRDLESYDFAKEKNIRLHSLFPIAAFGITVEKNDLPAQNFKTAWYFQSADPNYFYLVPKSSPVTDREKIYFGSDSGNFWALHQRDGSVAWNYKVGWHAKGKNIFSSPALHNGAVYFGAYDGNVYALDAATGKKKWIFMEADWVGSSPALAPELNMLFIGLEFGLINKRGGIVALNLETGEKKWEYSMPDLVHCSPGYYPEKQVVAIGCNNGHVSLLRAKDGKLLWDFASGGEVKASFVFDIKRNLICFGSFDGFAYCLDIDSGKVVHRFETQAAIYSTPLLNENALYVSSLDKRLYRFDLDTGKLNWQFECNGRVFANPVIIDEHIYVGATDGRLYEINRKTGESMSYFQATERITNKIAYHQETKRFFVPTYANEIYCLEKNNARLV